MDPTHTHLVFLPWGALDALLPGVKLIQLGGAVVLPDPAPDERLGDALGEGVAFHSLVLAGRARLADLRREVDCSMAASGARLGQRWI